MKSEGDNFPPTIPKSLLINQFEENEEPVQQDSNTPTPRPHPTF